LAHGLADRQIPRGLLVSRVIGQAAQRCHTSKNLDRRFSQKSAIFDWWFVIRRFEKSRELSFSFVRWGLQPFEMCDRQCLSHFGKISTRFDP
jgi:hypothetical protein